MKKGLTLLGFVMDRSGSMATIIGDSIGGFNTLIENQKQDCKDTNTEALVSLTIFNSQCNIIYNCTKIDEVEPLTPKVFYALGGTSLYDSVCNTIDIIGKTLKLMDEDERPEKVLITIITDGEENTSKEFTIDDLKRMISHQETKYNWVFNFIGANIDSFGVGGSYGVRSANTSNYVATTLGVKGMFRGVTSYATAYRSAPAGTEACMEQLSSFIDKETKI